MVLDTQFDEQPAFDVKLEDIKDIWDKDDTENVKLQILNNNSQRPSSGLQKN